MTLPPEDADHLTHALEDPDLRDDIAAIAATGVGRRWLLKAGLTTAAAAALLGRGTPAFARGAQAANAPASPEAGGPRHTLHLALGQARRLDDLVIVADGRRYPLIPHTPATRDALRAQGTLWRKARRASLTHYVSVPRPRDRSLVYSVEGTRRGKAVVAAQYVHVPIPATRALAKAAFALEGSYGAMVGGADRLGPLGLDPDDITSVADVLDLDTVVDPTTTAAAFLFCHPSIGTIDATASAATKSLLHATPEVVTLGNAIAALHESGQDWATKPTVLDKDGQPATIQVGSTTTTFSTVTVTKAPAFTAPATAAFTAGFHGIRDTGSLGVVLKDPLDVSPPTTATWHQREGVVPVAQPAEALGSTVSITVQNPGTFYGTTTTIVPGSTPGDLQLTLYNDFVRWVWVYVQYLAADGTNLSTAPASVFPNTRYARSLGLLPQVFTLLGIPLIGTNHITVPLDLPTEAVAARILYAGLGNGAGDGGWRQWFPADAYPDHVAPQDEVMVAGLITGILTIGLTAFCLLTDIDAATTWAAMRQAVESQVEDLGEVVDAILANSGILTGAESTATLIATGGVTYADIADNGGSAANIWSLLLALGGLIPKIIFNPGAGNLWAEIALILVGEEGASKVIECLPFIGEVVAAIAAAADALTLAQAVAETAASPWIIENLVTLTYPVTVTVSKDPTASTWPATARSWRLESKLDGATSLSSLTGEFNANGTQSDPVQASATAPFGGRTITWSFVTLDADGHQVGTGMSAQLANDDESNLPSSVSFAIKELPATVDAATVFERAITTEYTAASGGYTWATSPADTTTLADAAVQEVVGVTVTTRLGAVGYTWKQGDRYWLRGVPMAENGTSIPFGTATTQGYSRPPFLLFDPFVGAADVANHVLVEPNPTDPGYTVRTLTVDPATGDLTWDPTKAAGSFTLPVSAVALHSSGKVVAIETDSGRIGHLIPAETPLPPAAAYAAGPGTQPGLLSQPIALAITNPGIVIVLEAGANQLSAFDLNANPVRYFGPTTGPFTFTLPLPPGRTWLDLGVDGSNQIYLLSYEGDGSSPSDYRIDVYLPGGTPLTTNSPGTNLAKIAVDYWRSIFGANFSAVTDTATSQPRVDPALGVVEPSVSRLDPNG